MSDWDPPDIVVDPKGMGIWVNGQPLGGVVDFHVIQDVRGPVRVDISIVPESVVLGRPPAPEPEDIDTDGRVNTAGVALRRNRRPTIQEAVQKATGPPSNTPGQGPRRKNVPAQETSSMDDEG